MVADGEHDPEFDLIVESTGLDLEQVQSLKSKQADKETKSEMEKQCWNFFLIRWTRWRKASRVLTRREPAPSHKLPCRSGLFLDIFILRSPIDWH